MKELVFLLEEPSTKELLQKLLPRISQCQFKIVYIVFEGKSDLDKRIERKIRAYNNLDAVFFILRDQDRGDCIEIKRDLIEKCNKTGKRYIIRILCHELESWYLADLHAVGKAYNNPNLSNKQNSAKYRTPDSLTNPKQELKRIVPSYQEVSGSREIGKYLNYENTRSKSFAVFIKSYQKLLENNLSIEDSYS